MGENLLTTGQAAGATNLSLKTIRRYVSVFREFFSESARVTTRGRRYTAADIQTLLTIRHLFYERRSPDEIKSALAGSWSPPHQATYELEDIAHLVTHAQQLLQEAINLNQKTLLAINRAESTTSAATSELTRIRKQFGENIRLASAVERMEFKVMGFSARLEEVIAQL